jgi:hypothetical protein
MLRYLAFDNAAEANIISTVSSGKIIIVNSAAILDINETSVKKMRKQRMAVGPSTALATGILLG